MKTTRQHAAALAIANHGSGTSEATIGIAQVIGNTATAQHATANATDATGRSDHGATTC